MRAEQLHRFAREPAAFQEGIIIPSVHGVVRFGEVMGAFQRERFAGINGALLSVASGEKPEVGRHWWEATKGASKDSDLAVCLLWLLCFTGRPLTCQAAAADQDQAGELRKAMKDILRLNPWLASRVMVRNWQVVCEATGSDLAIIAADVAGSHGARPDVLVANELSHVTKQEFIENLFDNATKVPRGLAVVATNAGFLNTWQYRWRGMAVESGRWRTHIWSEPAPWLDEGELEEARKRNSNARFKRLFYGMWSSGGGDALDPDDLAAAVDRTLRPMTGLEPGFKFVGGLDLSVKQDHSGFVVVGVDGEHQRIQLADVWHWKPVGRPAKVDLVKVENAILEAKKRFRLARVCYDQYQAALMAQRLGNVGIKMQEVLFSGKGLDLMASTLLDVFRSRRFDMYEHKRLLDDLGRLSIVEKTYGYKLEAVRDDTGHADVATALAVCLPTAMEFMKRRGCIVNQWNPLDHPDWREGADAWYGELQKAKAQSGAVAGGIAVPDMRGGAEVFTRGVGRRGLR